MFFRTESSFRSAKKAWVRKTHIHKLQIRKFGSASRKSTKCNICGRFGNYLVLKLADLRFAELICERASLVLPLCHCVVCYFYDVPWTYPYVLLPIIPIRRAVHG